MNHSTQEKRIKVGYLPFWEQNPYQPMLSKLLDKHNVSIVKNPQSNLFNFLFNRSGINVLHIHWPQGIVNNNYFRLAPILFILLIYKILKNNIVWTIHEIEHTESRHPYLDKLLFWFLFKITKTFIVHSNYSKQLIRHKVSSRQEIRLARHPHYRNIYPQITTRLESRNRFSFSDKDIVFLFFGYIKPYKGASDLIKCFKQLSSDNIKLVIAGKPHTQKLAQEITNVAQSDPRIHLNLDYIDSKDVSSYFLAADIICFPFREIHTSGSIMLAQSYNKMFIAPHIGSIPEYASEDECIFFDPGSVTALIDALKESLSRLDNYQPINNCRYSWEDFAEIHHEIYSRLIETTGQISS